MPSPIAHAVAGYVTYKLFPKSKNLLKIKSNNFTALYFTFIGISPDLDFIPQLFTSIKLHRQLTHSIFFALIFSLGLWMLYRLFKTKGANAFFKLTFITYCSHLLLDALSPVGIPLLKPFSTVMLKLPITLFPNVHHSQGLFDSSHIIFICVELFYSLLALWTVHKLQNQRNYSLQTRAYF